MTESGWALLPLAQLDELIPRVTLTEAESPIGRVPNHGSVGWYTRGGKVELVEHSFYQQAARLIREKRTTTLPVRVGVPAESGIP